MRNECCGEGEGEGGEREEQRGRGTDGEIENAPLSLLRVFLFETGVPFPNTTNQSQIVPSQTHSCKCVLCACVCANGGKGRLA